MADKLTCPSCEAHTSAVFRAAMGVDSGGWFEEDPAFVCPHCGKPLPPSLYSDPVFQA